MAKNIYQMSSDTEKAIGSSIFTTAIGLCIVVLFNQCNNKETTTIKWNQFEETLNERRIQNNINPDGEIRIIGEKGDTTMVYNSHSKRHIKKPHTFAKRIKTEEIIINIDKGQETIIYKNPWKDGIINQAKENEKSVVTKWPNKEDVEKIITQRLQKQ